MTPSKFCRHIFDSAHASPLSYSVRFLTPSGSSPIGYSWSLPRNEGYPRRFVNILAAHNKPTALSIMCDALLMQVVAIAVVLLVLAYQLGYLSYVLATAAALLWIGLHFGLLFTPWVLLALIPGDIVLGSMLSELVS